MVWKLADAKNRLSELVTLATSEGPQTIRRHDAAVVVVDEEEYKRLIGNRPTLKELLTNGPSLKDLKITRDNSTMRSAKL